MGVLLFGISTFTAFLVVGELSEMLRRRKIEDKYVLNPSDYEELETGDALILIGETKSVREIKKLVG